jgi:hypothetical protein
MSNIKLKKSLLQIAGNITPETTIEEVYEQLALLADIDKSEEHVKLGKLYSHKEVKTKAKKWLK